MIGQYLTNPSRHKSQLAIIKTKKKYQKRQTLEFRSSSSWTKFEMEKRGNKTKSSQLCYRDWDFPSTVASTIASIHLLASPILKRAFLAHSDKHWKPWREKEETENCSYWNPFLDKLNVCSENKKDESTQRSFASFSCGLGFCLTRIFQNTKNFKFDLHNPNLLSLVMKMKRTQRKLRRLQSYLCVFKVVMVCTLTESKHGILLPQPRKVPIAVHFSLCG